MILAREITLILGWNIWAINYAVLSGDGDKKQYQAQAEYQ